MVWNNFEKFETISAEEVIENFDHAFAGSIFAKSPTSLENTSGVYDLGDQVDRWSNINIGNLLSEDASFLSFKMVDEVTIDSSTSMIEFSNINGDDSNFYIEFRGITTATSAAIESLRISLNEDSSSNYSYSRVETTGLSGGYAYASITSGFVAGQNDGIYSTFFSFIYLYTKSGYKRGYYSNNISEVNGRNVQDGKIYAGCYHESSSTITSVQLYKNSGVFGTGTTVRLWSI